jgi:UDP-glucose 4-epimerase
MHVLVTGGAGFIGSHLADFYLSEGQQVSVLDNLSTGSLANLEPILKDINFVNGDIRDSKTVDELISNSDLVLHMAAYLGVKNIMENTLESIESNFMGSEVVLKAATKYKKRIVLASTSEVYGKNTQQPLNEESDRVVGAPQMIRWTYSDSKSLEEASALVMHDRFALPATIARFFNTVGPRQTGQYGMVIPRFVQAALSNQNLVVYGDGTQSRVFCHVLDVVNAVDLLAKDEKTIGDYFNVGGIGEISILELAQKVIEMTHSKSKIEFVDYSEAYAFGFEDMQRRVPDISKITNKVGWKPTKNLEKILLDVIQSFSK